MLGRADILVIACIPLFYLLLNKKGILECSPKHYRLSVTYTKALTPRLINYSLKRLVTTKLNYMQGGIKRVLFLRFRSRCEKSACGRAGTAGLRRFLVGRWLQLAGSFASSSCLSCGVCLGCAGFAAFSFFRGCVWLRSSGLQSLGFSLGEAFLGSSLALDDMRVSLGPLGHGGVY